MPKQAFPLSQVYTLIEPGPVLLLSTSRAGQDNVMPMSWHTMLEFDPPLIGCVVSEANHSHGTLDATRECVLNIPTEELAEQVVACGNCSGRQTDKFAAFGLTRRPAGLVGAPLIDQCYASLECRVVDTELAAAYSMFVLEVLQAWVDPEVQQARTLHHRGYGRFAVAVQEFVLPSHMK